MRPAALLEFNDLDDFVVAAQALERAAIVIGLVGLNLGKPHLRPASRAWRVKNDGIGLGRRWLILHACLPCCRTGGSATGLPAIGAWRRAAADDDQSYSLTSKRSAG